MAKIALLLIAGTHACKITHRKFHDNSCSSLQTTDSFACGGCMSEQQYDCVGSKVRISCYDTGKICNGHIVSSTSYNPGQCYNGHQYSCGGGLEVNRTDMESKDTCSLYSIDGDTCGQSDLDCDYVKYAKAAEKSLQDGTCADQGFSVKTGTQTKSYPIIGDIVITTYGKGFDVAETVALTYTDCGSSSTHAKITGLKPETIDVPGKASVIGSGNLDADQTSASFSLKVKKAGIPLVSGKGSICEDTTIKVPLGAGSFTVKGIDCPIKTGNVDVQVDLDILSELVADGENSLLSIHIDANADDTGDQVICLDVDASLASFQV